MKGWLVTLRSPAFAREGLRMTLLTVLSFVLGFVLTSLLIEVAGLPAQAAYATAVVTCSVVNFFGCRYFVFHTSHCPLWPEALKFFISILLFRLVEIALFHVFVTLTGDYRIAYLATTALSTAGKFVTAKLFIFRSGQP